MKILRKDVAAYRTLDGSEIREYVHPDIQPGVRQSVAEATVEPGQSTFAHMHRQSEEVYHILAGTGRMWLGTDEVDVQSGDTLLIPPGTPHRIMNVGDDQLRILCCCVPPYRHEDTELLETQD